ncbi:GNAT family N-acetyltransferase [Actinoplanes solisilvae]|uniref:GNAT family N-acetyltransferase n=1 Tax=Actinoplanes solisilvae TaxID=2486853 RepID=UPI000FD8BC86|nr:GNAT family N-acetyltransferase [Actinoplanes solisilvae]
MRFEAELAEAAFMWDYETRMPDPARERLGVAGARIGGGVALAMVNDLTSYWSKALGFGVAEPFTPAVLDEVLGFYREHGVRQAVLQVVPELLPDGFAELAATRGLERGNPWIKLGGDPAAVTAGHSGLKIAPVGEQQAEQWANVVLETFGMPAGDLTTMLASTVGREGWRPFAAWDGDRVVAGANLYINGETAALNAAATLPTHRGQGAQSGLIAARAAAAVEAGCRRIVAETWKPAADGHNPSLENLRRAGLEPLYERDNWVWKA